MSRNEGERERIAQHRTCHDKLFISEQRKPENGSTMKKTSKGFQNDMAMACIVLSYACTQNFSLPIYFSISGSSNSSKKILTDSNTKKQQNVSGRFSDFTLCFLASEGRNEK